MTEQNEVSGIAIRCAHAAVVAVSELKPHPANPNLHPDGQIALLAKVIQHQGWRSPICVSNRSGFIVAGHGRYRAAKLLGVATVPVDYQDFATEADEVAHLLADNRIAELSETDGALLKELLTELDTGAFDMDLTGFDTEEMERVINHYPAESELKKIEIQKPPAMAWVLIGIATVRYSEIHSAIEAIAQIPNCIIETTVTDE